MHVLELIGAAGSSASVFAVFFTIYARRSSKHATAANTQRNLDRAEQTAAIQSAINELSKKVEARFDKNDKLTADNTRRIDRLDQEQFGPNGGGARQAINETAALVGSIDKRLIRIETIVIPPARVPAA